MPPTAEIPNNLMAKWQSDTAARGKRAARRPITACQTCRASKVKCDGRRRCSHCTARGVACVYAYPRTPSSSSSAAAACTAMPSSAAQASGRLPLEYADTVMMEDGYPGEWPALPLPPPPPPPPPTWTEMHGATDDLSSGDDGGGGGGGGVAAALLLRDAATRGGQPAETADYGAGSGVLVSEMCGRLAAVEAGSAVYDGQQQQGYELMTTLAPQLSDSLGSTALVMNPEYQDLNSGAYLQNGILDCERTLFNPLSMPMADQYASPGR